MKTFDDLAEEAGFSVNSFSIDNKGTQGYFSVLTNRDESEDIASQLLKLNALVRAQAMEEAAAECDEIAEYYGGGNGSVACEKLAKLFRMNANAGQA